MAKAAKKKRVRRIKLPDGQCCFGVWELAGLLRVQRSRIVEMIDEGELPGAVDIRNKGASRACWRIPRQSVIEALSNGSVHGHSEKNREFFYRIKNSRQEHLA